MKKIFGWFEAGIALFAAYICGNAVFEIATIDTSHSRLEFAPILIAITLPISLSFGWASWHLIRRQDWLQQAAPFFVIFAVACFVFAIDY